MARFVREVADNGATRGDVWVIYRRDRYLRGSDQVNVLEQGWPAARFTEPAEDFRQPHVRVENGVQFGDLPEFCDFDYIATVARVNGCGAVVAGRRRLDVPPSGSSALRRDKDRVHVVTYKARG